MSQDIEKFQSLIGAGVELTGAESDFATTQHLLKLYIIECTFIKVIGIDGNVFYRIL